jgi:hypothetical protein
MGRLARAQVVGWQGWTWWVVIGPFIGTRDGWMKRPNIDVTMDLAGGRVPARYNDEPVTWETLERFQLGDVHMN